MSLSSIAAPDRHGSPSLSVPLASNNPFRRAISPSPPSGLSPTSTGAALGGLHKPSSPFSNNPFLDDSEQKASSPATTNSTMSANTASTSPVPTVPDPGSHAAELFENLVLGTGQSAAPNVPVTQQPPPPPPASRRMPHQNSSDMPVMAPGAGPAPRPRPRPRPFPRDSPLPRGLSNDSGLPPRMPRSGAGPGPANPRQRGESALIDLFDEDDLLQTPRRPRRNSDTSVISRHEDDERVQRDRARDSDRYRERERERARRYRERSGRPRESREQRSERHRARSNRPVDLIDKLDLTSGVYGGSFFHHDGPFDACNPHRNRQGIRAAPMQAFAKDSKNMALGGAGPNHNSFDIDLFHGRTEDAYLDYSATAPAKPKPGNPVQFNPGTNIEPIHGAESAGLGTSTFLDGAPASRNEIQRRAMEEPPPPPPGGLQRTKSLAQRIRGINSRQRLASSPESIDGRNSRGSEREPRSPPRLSSRAAYVNGSGSGVRGSDGPPSTSAGADYDDAYERKGLRIQEAVTDLDRGNGSLDSGARVRADSVPPGKSSITRGRNESFSAGEDRLGIPGSGNSGGGGFISRVKSLRRRPTGM